MIPGKINASYDVCLVIATKIENLYEIFLNNFYLFKDKTLRVSC